MTAADLKEYAPEWVEPISTTYRGWTVYELPPNTQGIAALMMLNLMERFPLGEYGFHIMGGCFNQAHADAQFVANLADYGMDIQEALEAGRFTKGSFQGCDVSIEALVPEAGIRRALSRAVRCGVFPRAFRSDLPVWLQGNRRGARPARWMRAVALHRRINVSSYHAHDADAR